LASHRFALCGPIAEPGRPARGGYESANLRTLELLRAQGLRVDRLDYPVAVGSKLQLLATYLGGFVGLVWRILTARPAYALVHFTPHFRPFLYAEALIAAAVWIRGGALCLDVRAGSVPHFFNRAFPPYKALFRCLLRRAEMVTCEGARDVAWLRELGARDPWRLPNWIAEPATEPALIEKAATPATIVYCGRIIPTKGVDTLIEVVRILHEQGLNVGGLVIGDGPAEYVENLQKASQGLHIEWTGALAPAEVARRLASAHIFLFATSFYGEGQSNALTEAMAQGLAPIVSDHGFSADVAGDAGVVLPVEACAKRYAEAVRAMIVDGSLLRRGAAARERIRTEFSAAAVAPLLLRGYRDAIRRSEGG
jgi:glycosyltransferase involved in cell wall biosynthesis